MAIHSFTSSVPGCPEKWERLWIGYSLMMVSNNENYLVSGEHTKKLDLIDICTLVSTTHCKCRTEYLLGLWAVKAPINMVIFMRLTELCILVVMAGFTHKVCDAEHLFRRICAHTNKQNLMNSMWLYLQSVRCSAL